MVCINKPCTYCVSVNEVNKNIKDYFDHFEVKKQKARYDWSGDKYNNPQ